MRMLGLGACTLCLLAIGCGSGGAKHAGGSGSGSGGSGGSGGDANSSAGSGGSDSNSNGGSGTTGSGTGGSGAKNGEAGAGPLDPSDQVASCSANLSGAEVDANLELVNSLSSSVHELVACGGLTVRVVGALVDGVIDMIISNDDDITPDGLTFQGDGTYQAGGSDPNQNTDMLIRFYDDSSGTPELVTDDLFRAETYLVGASAEQTTEVDTNNILNSTVYVDISFDAPGPRVAMLGFGDNPESPIRIELSDVPYLSPQLDDIVVETAVTVVDTRGDAVVDYDVETGPDPVLDIFNGQNLDYRILGVDGANTGTGQTLELADDGWQIEFAGGNKLDGTIAFSIAGGDFDYDGVFTYDSAPYADIALSCSQ